MSNAPPRVRKRRSNTAIGEDERPAGIFQLGLVIRVGHIGGKICLFGHCHAELGGCECFDFMGSPLWLQDSEGFVVAAPGPSQCSRPQVSVGRFPLKQDSAQVPRGGCKQHRELSNKNFFFSSEQSPLSTLPSGAARDLRACLLIWVLTANWQLTKTGVSS